MKLIHTSDWHLGHLLYNYDRGEEQSSMLNQLTEIVKKEQPDVFLLCGDVFDTYQPSTSVQKMFIEGMLAIHEACPGMVMVMTAGNHDSGSKHEVNKELWQFVGGHVIGNIYKDAIAKHIIEIPGKGYVIAVPYAYEKFIPENFFKDLTARVKEVNKDNLPVIMTAHTTVNGVDFTGHERVNEKTIGNIDSVGIETFGEGYDYLALGHIHKPQFIHTGKHNVRYSGSPIAVSFDESYNHTVSIVEISGHGERPEVREVEIENIKPLVTLPIDGYGTYEEVMEILKKFEPVRPSYVRLQVKVEDSLPYNANYSASILCEEKGCSFCLFNTKRKEAEASEIKTMSVDEFMSCAPIEIFTKYIESQGMDVSGEMRTMVESVIAEVNEEKRNNNK